MSDHVLWLGEGDVASVGGKAAGLARLIAAGLPVPPGAVITTAAYRARAIPEVDLPGPLAVRSSATIEDGERGAAPGLFASVLGVTPRGLADAVRTVWDSARAPAVDAYLEARRLDRAALAMAVIVQQQVSARDGGTLYSRLPGDPTSARMLVERRDGTWQELDRDDASDLARLARDAERALGCAAVDVEWVRDDDQLWIVQARPIPALPSAPAPPPSLFAFSRAEPAVTWRWDVAHNPDPLSPAQIGLVERVGGESLRVVDGYLYVAERRGAVAAPAGDLDAIARDALAAMEAALAACDGSLPSALAAYDEVARTYAHTLTPALRAARRELPALLARHLPAADVEHHVHALLGASPTLRLEELVAAVAEGLLPRDELLAIAAPLSPAWDVAVPTYGERPELLDRAIALARAAAGAGAARAAVDAEQHVRAALPLGARRAFDDALAAARAAADLAERDDRVFARAQAAVRRALLALGHGDDIFYLPLADVARGAIDLSRASAARAELARQRARAMPLAFRDGVPLPAAPVASTVAWRGRGCGGAARGPVARIDSLAGALAPSPGAPLAPGSILVAPTITPAMTFLLHGAAAIVSAHGGLLDHGAAIARELGVPCVVGCPGAWSSLREGDAAFVDGAAGLVIRL